MSQAYKLRPYVPKAKYVPQKKSPEKTVHAQACRFLKIQWPHIIFRTDFASGMKLTLNQAVQHKSLQSSRAFPDIFIYKPMKIDGKQYAGAGFELKKEGTCIIVSRGPKKGELTNDAHVREQYLMLQALDKLGFYTDFCVGIDDFITKANWYLSGGVHKPENSELF